MPVLHAHGRGLENILFSITVPCLLSSIWRSIIFLFKIHILSSTIHNASISMEMLVLFSIHSSRGQNTEDAFCPIKNRPRFCCSCQGLPTALCLFSTTAHLKMFLSISSPGFHCLETPLRNPSVWKTCRRYKTHCPPPASASTPHKFM